MNEENKTLEQYQRKQCSGWFRGLVTRYRARFSKSSFRHLKKVATFSKVLSTDHFPFSQWKRPASALITQAYLDRIRPNPTLTDINGDSFSSVGIESAPRESHTVVVCI